MSEPLVQQLLQQVFILTAETAASVAALLKELDLTEPLVTALWRLDPEAPPPPMRALAAAMHCDPSTMSFITDRLEQRGFIRRQVDPTDRRVKVVALTRQGIAARARFVEAVTTTSPLARLSRADRQQLHRLLRKAGLDEAQFTCQSSPLTIGT